MPHHVGILPHGSPTLTSFTGCLDVKRPTKRSLQAQSTPSTASSTFSWRLFFQRIRSQWLRRKHLLPINDWHPQMKQSCPLHHPAVMTLKFFGIWWRAWLRHYKFLLRRFRRPSIPYRIFSTPISSTRKQSTQTTARSCLQLLGHMAACTFVMPHSRCLQAWLELFIHATDTACPKVTILQKVLNPLLLEGPLQGLHWDTFFISTSHKDHHLRHIYAGFRSSP